MKTRSDLIPAPQRGRPAAQREALTSAGAGAAGNQRDAAQLERIQAAFGAAPAQLAGEEEELQMKADLTAQRAGLEEEEPLQGQFVAQRAGPEEEEALQGRFVAQRVEEEELMQGKFVAQRVEEEEPLQGQFVTQRVEEEEPLQGQFEAQAPQNKTGMPDALKSGMEALSGLDLSDVRVHANSSEPAQLNAHAFAQGRDIHLAPGQEQHLPHEAWHVVQQRQGRVQANVQVGGVPVNDNPALEAEADAMGARALAEPVQRQAVFQLRPRKFVTEHAKVHFGDWGPMYGVTTVPALKAKVPRAVEGQGSISLGQVRAPDAEQTRPNKTKYKNCSIGYKDGRYQNETTIFACGPLGRPIWR